MTDEIRKKQLEFAAKCARIAFVLDSCADEMNKFNVDMVEAEFDGSTCNVLMKPEEMEQIMQASQGLKASVVLICDHLQVDFEEFVKDSISLNPKRSRFYDKYIQSDEWKAKKEKRLAMDEHRCVVCGSQENLQVHHITYENLGKEKMEDLITLCGRCHKRMHNR